MHETQCFPLVIARSADHGTTFRAVERLFVRTQQGETAMPTQFDMTHLLDLLDPSEDDRPIRVFVGAIVVVWALACLVIWGAS
jgi:hypothetical protein